MDRDRDEDTLSFSALVQPPNTPENLRTSPHHPVRQLPGGTSFKFQAGISSPPPSPADVLFANGSILPKNSVAKGHRELRARRRGTVKSPKRVAFQGVEVSPPKSSLTSHVTDSSSSSSSSSTSMVQIGDLVNVKRETRKSKGGFLGCCKYGQAMEPSKQVANVGQL